MAIPAQKRIEGKYEILEKLSEGGMGAVYKVRHRLLEEIRVVKVMRSQIEESGELRTRFLREAKVAARMRHSNIAQLYDFTVDDDGTAFMVMEFVDGTDLIHLLQDAGPVQVGILLDIGIQSLQALQYLHRRNVVHRDISPDNLMLARDEDGNPLVKLIDLGIAKPLSSDLSLTKSGFFIGKVRYASPEQFGGPDGDAEIDNRSDLYSLGVVLYEILTGEHPIEGSDYKSLVAGHMFRPPKDFAATDPTGRVPAELRSALMKSLEKLPDQRYASADEFSRHLRQIKQSWIAAAAEDGAAPEPTELASQPPPGGVSADTAQHELDSRFAPEPTPSPAPLHVVEPTAATDQSSRHRVETLLKTGQLAAAEEQIRRVTEAGPLDPILEGLQMRLQDLRARVQGILDQAKVLKESGNLEGALEELRKARGLDADNAEVGVLLAEVEKALEEQSRAAQEARRTIERHLNAGDLAAAARKLAEAVRIFAAVQDFSDLAGRLEKLQAVERHAQAISKVSQNVERLLSERRLDDATEALASAINVHGSDEAFDELAERIEGIRTIGDRVEALVRNASDLAADGDHPAAIQKLEEARELDPVNGKVRDLLARHRAALEQAQRKQQEEGLLERAERLIAKGRLEAARVAAKEGLAVNPASASAKALLAEIDERQAEVARSSAAAEARRIIESHLAEGRLSHASKALATAERDHGAVADFDDLRERLTKLRSSSTREREIAKSAAKVRSLLARRQVDRAAVVLKGAIGQHGAQKAFDVLAGQIEEAQAQRRLKKLEKERARVTAAKARAERQRPGRTPMVAAGAGVLVVVMVIVGILVGRAPAPEQTRKFTKEDLRGLDFGSYHALLIGNNAYQKGLTQLETAVSDAEALATVLAGVYGFKVTLLRDVGRYEILSALELLAKELGAEDNLLLFYAGHGYLNPVDGLGYWQPVDAEPDSPANWISSLTVADILLETPVKRVLVVTDSCFSAAFAGPEADSLAPELREVNNPEQLRELLPRRSRLALTSGSLQPVLDTGTEGRSVFAKALLDILDEEPAFLDAGAVFEEVRSRVTNAVSGMGIEQTPQYMSLETDEGGGFFFVPESLLDS